ncbi:selenoprotein M-like [Diretmus argenteus]
MWLFTLTWLLHCALAYNVEQLKKDGLAKAKVEVKAFVKRDIPLYHNLVKKHIPGADPELVLINNYNKELDRIDLTYMSRSEINELLGELGFYKKAAREEEVPEEFRFAPAKDNSRFEEPPESQSTSTPTETSEPESEDTHSEL